MPSTFGGFWVQRDPNGANVVLSLPRGLEEINIQRMQYSGPRVIMPERVTDFEKWLDERKQEGFVLKVA